jgi:hypothetical protein
MKTQQGYSERARARREYRRALVALTPSMPRLDAETRERNAEVMRRMAGGAR